MKRHEFQETWSVLIERLAGLGEPILGKRFCPELRKALEDLETYRDLLNYSHDAILLVDPDSGLIERANDTACRLLQLDREALREMRLEDVAGPEERRLVSRFLADLSREAPASRRTLCVDVNRPEGSGLQLELSLNKMAGRDRAWIVVVARNVSERKRAETTLRESHQRYLNMLDAVPDLLYERTPDGILVYANRTACGKLGLTPEDFGTINLSAFLEVEQADRWRGESTEIREGAPPRSFSCHLKTADGRLLPVEVRETLVVRRGREPTFLGVARDVTDRKQLEERMLRSQRMQALGRLSGGIAHEYNNLMTAITGYAELILADLKGDDSLRKRVEEIRRAGEMATELTRQLLAFDRKQVLRPGRVDLNTVVSHMEKTLLRLIGEDVHLVTELEPEIGATLADRAQLEQAVLNLAINSRDAMPEGGTITIETRNQDVDAAYAARHVPMKPGPYVVLSFSDTGTGMAPEIQSQILEPFFTTRETEKRTGMGLSTVYGIVKQSGGYIWVSSEPDHGATFQLFLPRAEDEADLPAVPFQPPASRDLLGTETVLVVEDQDSIRELACEVLQGKGYKVLGARNAGEALLICEQHTGLIHLMVTDIVMPRMGGRELAERLQPWHPEMKVLYMSGYTETDLHQKGLPQAGASFLEKPFSPHSLASKVREVLDEARNPGSDAA